MTTDTTTYTAPRKVIFDTDPGVDDAMALYFALAHPGIDVVGITTTFGNVRVEQAARNALYLSALALPTGRTMPVCQGAAAPLQKPLEPPPHYIHGADGLGNLPTRLRTCLRSPLSYPRNYGDEKKEIRQ